MENESKTEKAIEELGNRELGGVKVLMVEDDSFMSELVLTKLSADGCIPYSTTDSSEALELAAQYQPDVIILDLMLPGISGEELLESLKKNDSLKTIPVIVFSNKSKQSEVQKVMDLGADQFLMKSRTDLSELAQIVKKTAGGAV